MNFNTIDRLIQKEGLSDLWYKHIIKEEIQEFQIYACAALVMDKLHWESSSITQIFT